MAFKATRPQRPCSPCMRLLCPAYRTYWMAFCLGMNTAVPHLHASEQAASSACTAPPAAPHLSPTCLVNACPSFTAPKIVPSLWNDPSPPLSQAFNLCLCFHPSPGFLFLFTCISVSRPACQPSTAWFTVPSQDAY